MLKKLLEPDFIFTSMESSETRQFTFNMLEFLFLSDLIFTTTSSLGARVKGSSGAPNAAVYLEHANFFI
jgi:hypothetical protein